MAFRWCNAHKRVARFAVLQSSGLGVPAAPGGECPVADLSDPDLSGIQRQMWLISDSILGEALDFIVRFRLDNFILVF